MKFINTASASIGGSDEHVHAGNLDWVFAAFKLTVYDRKRRNMQDNALHGNMKLEIHSEQNTPLETIWQLMVCDSTALNCDVFESKKRIYSNNIGGDSLNAYWLFSALIHHIYINCWFPVHMWSVM